MSQPITREEQYLYAMASGNSTDIKPVTREEMYLAKATGQSVAIPEPVTRKEVFLRDIALGSSGGGSVILKPFTLTKGGTYKANDYGADGFSSVFADVDPAPIWDESFTITGEPSEEGGGSDNSPKAYHLTSADELPTDAVDGSLAVVEESDSLVGEWLLNEVLDFGITNEEIRISGEFIIHVSSNLKEGVIYAERLVFYAEDGWTYISCYSPLERALTIYDTDNDPVWATDRSRELTILACDDERMLNILKLTATRISGGHTLYSRENGEWVNKGEI